MTAKTDVAVADPRPRIRLAPEARREQILREATRLIARSGFNGISLAAVADACDVRKPSVLHYFPSMTELLNDVLRRRDEHDYLALGAVTVANPTPERVREFLGRVIARNLQQRELIRLDHVLAAEALDPTHPVHAYFGGRARSAHDEMRRMLAWKDDPEAAAIELLAFWDGLEFSWVRDANVDFVAIWDRFCERFFV